MADMFSHLSTTENWHKCLMSKVHVCAHAKVLSVLNNYCHLPAFRSKDGFMTWPDISLLFTGKLLKGCPLSPILFITFMD